MTQDKLSCNWPFVQWCQYTWQLTQPKSIEFSHTTVPDSWLCCSKTVVRKYQEPNTETKLKCHCSHFYLPLSILLPASSIPCTLNIWGSKLSFQSPFIPSPHPHSNCSTSPVTGTSEANTEQNASLEEFTSPPHLPSEFSLLAFSIIARASRLNMFLPTYSHARDSCPKPIPDLFQWYLCENIFA